MPFNGGLSPYPERSGGGRPIIGRITDSLLAQLGTAYSSTSDTFVYARAQAYARAIAEVYSTNQRLAYQWDPLRTTDFLPRWETILGLYPLPTDSLVSRRLAVAAKWLRFGRSPTYQTVVDAIAAALGSDPLPATSATKIKWSIDHTSSSSANVWTPHDWPFGQHSTGGPVPNTMIQFLQVYPDWYSTVSEIKISLAMPASMTEAEFYRRIGNMELALDPLVPAWTTWSWIRLDAGELAGFILDAAHNLDNKGLDS